MKNTLNKITVINLLFIFFGISSLYSQPVTNEQYKEGLKLDENMLEERTDHNMFEVKDRINPADSNTLFLRITNVNLFHNLELFNYIENGYTLFGYWLRPELVYYPTSNTMISAGVNLLKYDGRPYYTQVYPTFKFQYTINENISMLMGTLYGSQNHEMIEPFYNFERELGVDYEKNYTVNNTTILDISTNVENGFEFLAKYPRFKGDAWLSWEQFIYRFDPWKEKFCAGITTKTYLTDPASKLVINIPFQFLANHAGGQETESYLPAKDYEYSTIMDFALGLSVNYKIDKKFFKSVGCNVYGALCWDVSPKPDSLLNPNILSGTALYVISYLNTSWINFSLSFWNADRFVAPRGDPMYQSISTETVYPYNTTNATVPQYLYVVRRDLIVPRIYIHHQIAKGIELGAAYQSYIDVVKSQPQQLGETYDFYYSLYIVFKGDFRIHKFKPIVFEN